jgi:hypothetical protein
MIMKNIKVPLIAAVLNVAASMYAQSYVTGTITDNSFLTLAGPSSAEVYGVNFAGPAQTTLNGYFFAADPNNGGLAPVSYAGGANAQVPAPTFLGGGGTTGDASLNAILGSGEVPGPNPSVLILNGLIPGTTYNLLVFNADTRNGINQDRAFSITHNSLQSPSQVYAFTGGVGGMGGYILDTFTASGISESINVNQPNGAQLNGILLVQVPEPGALAMLSCGFALLAFRMRKRGR